jgi:hypothetical protein
MVVWGSAPVKASDDQQRERKVLCPLDQASPWMGQEAESRCSLVVETSNLPTTKGSVCRSWLANGQTIWIEEELRREW